MSFLEYLSNDHSNVEEVNISVFFKLLPSTDRADVEIYLQVDDYRSYDFIVQSHLVFNQLRDIVNLLITLKLKITNQQD